MTLLNKISLMLVDDHDMFRQGLRSLIDENRFEVIAEASNGRDALNLAHQMHPDVLLLDVQMPGMNGVQVARQIRRESPETKVIFLSMSDDHQDVVAAIDAGGMGYIPKTASAESLNRALSLVADGESVFPSELLRGGLSAVPLKNANLPPFTPRETEILRHLALGYSNKEIGRMLDVAEGTVKVHIKAILKKLNMRNRTQVAIYAHENGFAQPLAGSME